MTKAELRAALDQLAIERRSYLEEVKKGTGEFNAEEAQKKLAEMDSRAADLEKQIAELDKPVATRNEGLKITNRDLLDAVAEKRSITIGSNGQINQVKQLFEGVQDTDDILNKISYDYGPNASTNIPVLEPGLEDPSAQSEGATNISADSTAALATTEIQPKCYVAVLPITAEQLQLGSVDIEAKLPELFRKVFRKKMHKELFVGDGSSKNVKGIWTSAAANTAGVTPLAGASIKPSELATLALKVAQKDEEYEILMNPATYGALMANTAEDGANSAKVYKETLIRDKTIEGIKVRLDPQCPSTTAATSVLAVAAPLSRFHMGVAGEVTITPIRVRGDTNTYFQAEAFFGGKQVSDKDLYSVAVPASTLG